MFGKLLTKIFGTNNERVVKRLLPVVDQINSFESQLAPLTDKQLRAKTIEFRARITARLEGITDADAIKAAEKAALDELLPEAFAASSARPANERSKCATLTCS